MRRIFSIMLLTLAVVVPTAAQGDGPQCHCHGTCAALTPEMQTAFSQLHERVTAMMQTTVLPQLRQWKSDFESQMSAEDLHTLQNLRTRAAEVARTRGDLVRELRQARKDGVKPSEDFADRRDAMITEWKDIRDGLRTLAATYHDQLKMIGENALPTMEQWHQSAEELYDTWATENKEVLANSPIPVNSGFMRRIIAPSLAMWTNHCGMVERFLLWDGGDITRQQQTEAEDGVPDLK